MSLATSYFDLKEYDRAAYVLRDLKNPLPYFLHMYAEFLAEETRRLDNASDSVGLYYYQTWMVEQQGVACFFSDSCKLCCIWMKHTHIHTIKNIIYEKLRWAKNNTIGLCQQQNWVFAVCSGLNFGSTDGRKGFCHFLMSENLSKSEMMRVN